MGNLPCCQSRKHALPGVKTVLLYDEYGKEVCSFDNIKIAATLRDRHIGYAGHAPEDNECYLLPSSHLPPRLRTIYAPRKCSNLTILFCKSFEKNSYIVQEQATARRSSFDITTEYDGDLIIQCKELAQPVFTVKIEMVEN